MDYNHKAYHGSLIPAEEIRAITESCNLVENWMPKTIDDIAKGIRFQAAQGHFYYVHGYSLSSDRVRILIKELEKSGYHASINNDGMLTINWGD